MDDRRQEARKSTSDYFLVYDSETDQLIGRVLDLTCEGAMMISEAQVDIPKAFKCRLVLPRMYGKKRMISFEAESIRCEKNLELDWFETGYRIFNISSGDHAALKQVLGEWAVKKSAAEIKSL